MTISGTPSRAISTACAWRSWCGAKRRRTPASRATRRRRRPAASSSSSDMTPPRASDTAPRLLLLRAVRPPREYHSRTARAALCSRATPGRASRKAAARFPGDDGRQELRRAWRLLRKWCASPDRGERQSPALPWKRPGRSDGGRCGRAPELEQVVGGGDEPPFRAAGRSASALEAIDPAVELRVSEDRFDHGGPFGVELGAGRGGQRAAHECVEAA